MCSAGLGAERGVCERDTASLLSICTDSIDSPSLPRLALPFPPSACSTFVKRSRTGMRAGSSQSTTMAERESLVGASVAEDNDTNANGNSDDEEREFPSVPFGWADIRGGDEGWVDISRVLLQFKAICPLPRLTWTVISNADDRPWVERESLV
jgi:hypothetical protein